MPALEFNINKIRNDVQNMFKKKLLSNKNIMYPGRDNVTYPWSDEGEGKFSLADMTGITTPGIAGTDNLYA